MSPTDRIRQQKHAIIREYARPDNARGLAQAATTLIPLAALWYLATLSTQVSYWLTAGVVLLMSLFLVRVFVLMHECGHGSMFRSVWLNKAFGFVFGVVSGMPQYVWSQHHHYHHATNGNWAKYRGPLSVCTVEEFGGLTDEQQHRYQRARSIWMAPVAGFLYLVFSPRFTWLKGSAQLVGHVVRKKLARPEVPLAAHAAKFRTPYWTSAREYWHMFGNNLVLLGAWAAMCWYVGAGLFFAVYIVSVSLAGAAGIVLFAVQHNFGHSYASGNEGWDRDAAALHGTSFLVLPPWLNWFTANIAYHHIHHLSPRIPNYRLAECHDAYQHLFHDVTRITLAQIAPALKHVLWDVGARRIISVAEYRQIRNQTA